MITDILVLPYSAARLTSQTLAVSAPSKPRATSNIAKACVSISQTLCVF